MSLLFFRQTVDLAHLRFKFLENQWQQGVVLIIHLSLGKALDGALQALSVNRILVRSLEGPLQFLLSGLDKFLKHNALVVLFEVLGLLENIERSVGKVVLQLEILVGEEVVDRLGLNFVIGFVNIVVLQLLCGFADLGSQFVLDQLVIVDLFLANIVIYNFGWVVLRRIGH